MIVTQRRSRRGSRSLAYLLGFIALVAIAQIAVTIPRWDEGRAKVSIALALLLIVVTAVMAARTWGAGGTDETD